MADALGAMKARDAATFAALSKQKFTGDLKDEMEAAFKELEERTKEAAGNHVAQEAALDRISLFIIYLVLNSDLKIDSIKTFTVKIKENIIKELTLNLKLFVGSLICGDKVMKKDQAMEALGKFPAGERFLDTWGAQLGYRAGEDVDASSKYKTSVGVLTTKRMIEAISLICHKVLSRMSILTLGTQSDRLAFIGNLFNAEHVRMQGMPMEERVYTSCFLLVKLMYGESPHAYMGLKTKSVLSVRIVPAKKASHAYKKWEQTAADLDKTNGTDYTAKSEKTGKKSKAGKASAGAEESEDEEV